MKKAAVVFILCLALVLGTATAGGLALSQSREQVEVTAVTLKGDPAAAEGFTAYQSAHYNYHLLWDSAIPLADPAGSVTEYSYHFDQKDLMDYWSVDTEVYLDIPGNSTHFFHQTADPLSEKTFDRGLRPLLPLFREIAGRTEAGERHSETVNLADYLDYYPLQAEITLRAPVRYGLDYDIDSPNEVFQDFFRFPVPADERWTLTVEKDEDGGITQLETYVPEPVFHPSTVTAVSEQAIYFILDGYSQKLPSLEEIPGGNGIYRMEMENISGVYQIDVMSLSNAFSLPLDAVPLALTLSADGKDLLVAYCLGEEYTCLALDAATMTVKQSVSVPAQLPKPAVVYSTDTQGIEFQYSTTLWGLNGALAGDNFLLLYGEETLHLYSLGAEGYTYEFSAPMEDHLRFYPYDHLRGAWNGEKLALGTVANDYNRTLGLTLSVFEDGKLLYQGAYQTSLDDLPPDLDREEDWEKIAGFRQGGSVELWQQNALQIEWTGEGPEQDHAVKMQVSNEVYYTS